MEKSVKNIAWAAGLLEGEGCFYMMKSSPLISIQMTDFDTIEKFKELSGINNKIYTRNRPERKPIYCFQITGNLAIQWMMTVYPLLSLRRRAAIREILHKWKNKSSYGKGFYVSNPHKNLLKAFKGLGLTQEEAEIKLLEMINEGEKTKLVSEE